MHDDHSKLMELKYLNLLCSQLKINDIAIANLTYEKNVSNEEQLVDALDEIAQIKSVLSVPTLSMESKEMFASIKQVTADVRIKSEKKGRNMIALSRLRTQLPDFCDARLTVLLNLLGLTKLELAEQFSDVEADHFDYGIPFYTKGCVDHIDLSLAFYLYCSNHLRDKDKKLSEEILNDILVEIACNHLATLEFNSEEQPTDTGSYYRAILGFVGVGSGLLVSKYLLQDAIKIWCIVLAGLFIVGAFSSVIGLEITICILFYLGGILATLGLPVQRQLYHSIRENGGNDSFVMSNHWVYNALISITLFPINFISTDSFSKYFTTPMILPFTLLAILGFGLIGGYLVLKQMRIKY